MEQLTAIVFDDVERGICVGYKDISPDEFWVRGHMPGMPLMPGVIMCEAAAQLCSYHVQTAQSAGRRDGRLRRPGRRALPRHGRARRSAGDRLRKDCSCGSGK